MTEKPDGGKWRLRILSLAVMVGFLVVSIRLCFLQLIQAPLLTQRAEKQRQKTVMVEGERGTIYDRKGRILAINVDLPSIYSTPADVVTPPTTARKLASILGQNPERLKQRLQSDRGFVWIERKVDPSVAKRIRGLHLEGIGFLQESQRFYPKRYLMAHLLGFAGLDNEGLEGIELKYNSYLRGEKGWVVLERDALGGSVFPKGLNYALPARGKDLILTIDEVIQFISERELDRVLEETSAKSGLVIVMDPKSGEILALAVRPDFNPNRVGVYDPAEWRNRAITDLYEPGSTFKMITAAAALEEHAVTPEEKIDCENGAYAIGGGVLHDHEPHGVLTFYEVVQKSSNVGMAKVAMRLGDERLYRYVKAFGFGEKSGIDLNGESAGMVHPTSQWSGRSLASVAIGQEVGVTAVQVIRAASVFANGGYLPQPHLVSEIRDQHGGVVKRFTPPTERRVVSGKTVRLMTEILGGVVRKGGTGEMAALEGYSVAGKTGTAQKVNPATGRYGRDQVISSFVGYAPADEPRIVVYVVVDEPKGVNWGGSVAAPVFKRVAEQSLSYLGVLPQKGDRILLVAHR